MIPTNGSSPGAAPTPAATRVRRPMLTAWVESGVLAGLLGALVVAVWFLLLDSLRGEPFHTPSLLGSVLFLGAQVEAVTAVNAVMVFAFTGVHVLIFLVGGTALAWMFAQFEAHPQFGLLLLLLFILAEAILFGFEAAIVPQLVGALGAWAVALGNLAAAVAMIWFLLRRHPRAVDRLRHAWNED